MAAYRTVAGEAAAEIVEKRSRFIARIAPAATEEEALAFIEAVRAEHRMARHNVYAYVLRGGRVRYTDDGEPAKTAGMPTLEAVQHAGLEDVAVVVTRYFGGVLLGTGGLVRAYGDATRAAIAAADVVSVSRVVDVLAEVPYRLYEPAVRAAEAAGEPAPASYALGEARPVDDAQALFDSEYRQQYRSLPFWKRSVILLAGIFMNLLFAMLVFILVFSVIGFTVQHPETGEVMTVHASVLQALQAGFMYIGMVVQAVAGLFNPATAAQTVSDSTSIVGIAVLSKQAVEAGAFMALQFMAMISVSLGIMNLIPIPPLDGGRFVVEVFQKATRKVVSPKAMGYMSMAGMALFLGFFAIMLNQDIQNLIAGTGVFGPPSS